MMDNIEAMTPNVDEQELAEQLVELARGRADRPCRVVDWVDEQGDQHRAPGRDGGASRLRQVRPGRPASLATLIPSLRLTHTSDLRQPARADSPAR
jgi:hypothetical protein